MTDAPAAIVRPTNALTGWTFALLSTLAFSLASPIAKGSYDYGLNPTVMVACRYLITIGLLVVAGLIWPVRHGPLDRRAKLIAIGTGLIHGAGTLSFYWALTDIDAGLGSMLFTLYPLVTLLLLALRGEKFTYRNLIRLALALGGVYLLIGPGGQVTALGLALVGVSILASALQTVISQWYLRDYDQQSTLRYMVLGMAATSTGYWLVTGGSLAALPASLPVWGAILALAVICTYVAWATWFIAMRHVGGGPVAMLVPLETFLTVIWSVSFLGERLTLVQWLGGLLILTSTLLAVQRLGRVRRWPWQPEPPQP